MELSKSVLGTVREATPEAREAVVREVLNECFNTTPSFFENDWLSDAQLVSEVDHYLVLKTNQRADAPSRERIIQLLLEIHINRVVDNYCKKQPTATRRDLFSQIESTVKSRIKESVLVERKDEITELVRVALDIGLVGRPLHESVQSQPESLGNTFHSLFWVAASVALPVTGIALVTKCESENGSVYHSEAAARHATTAPAPSTPLKEKVVITHVVVPTAPTPASEWVIDLDSTSYQIPPSTGAVDTGTIGHFEVIIESNSQHTGYELAAIRCNGGICPIDLAASCNKGFYPDTKPGEVAAIQCLPSKKGEKPFIMSIPIAKKGHPETGVDPTNHDWQPIPFVKR